MELTAVKMTMTGISNDNSAIISRIEKLEKAVQGGKFIVEKPAQSVKEDIKSNKSTDSELPPPEIQEEAKSEPSSNDSHSSTDEDTLFIQWGEVLSLLDVSDKPLIGILGTSSAYIRGDFILIKCDNPVFSQFIRQNNHSLAIRKAVFDVTGRKYRLGIYKSNDNKAVNNDPLANLIKKING